MCFTSIYTALTVRHL